MNRADVACLDIPEPSWIGRAADYALKALSARGIDGWDLSLAFCGDEKMRELNARYRDKDEPTDVLSFELGERVEDEELGERFLPGDIVISLDSLASNAERFSVDRDQELRRLIIHGMLHLSGMDHQDNDPSREMLALQEKILSDLSEERIL